MSLKDTDVRTPGIASIARKWKLPVAEVARLVAQGAKHEKEHNTNQSKAEEVARDHINERPDYYKMLSKAEKTKVKIKEETGISGVRGLGYVTGDPAVDYIQNYIDTNSMAYQDENGNKLDLIKKKHLEYHNSKLGFNFFDPTDGNASNKTLKEAKHPLQVNFDKYRKGKLNELGGNIGYEGLTDAPPKKNGQLEEGPLKDKAKKVVMAGMTAANMYTMADAVSQHKPNPQDDVIRATTALPGAAGWGASAVHYGKKGYDLAKATLKKKQMEEETFNEDLRKWFREKWVRYDTKGNIKGPCAREEGEGKPKCRPLASARSMSKDERAKSARRKRREDPVADRPGKGGKPIMVNTNEETLLEKNVPTNPALWARAKAQAKAKFDVYPSAYANGWASKWYKSKGGGWKSAANESVDEACWDNYKQEGMKKKGNKMVPNCVPVEEQGSSATPYTERPTYESAAWQRSAGKDPEGGLNRKGIASYRREHPGSKLSMAVTTKPSKLDPDSKPAKRRKSFCARMGGMKGPMKDEKGRPTRKALALRKWNCEEEKNALPTSAERGIYEMDTDNMPISKNIEDRRPSLLSSMLKSAHQSIQSGIKSGSITDLKSVEAQASDAVKRSASDYFSKQNRDNNVLDKKDYKQMNEKHLTPAETKKKEEIVMSMKKGLPGMKKRYGERAKEVLYATATKRAKQVAEEHIREDGFDLDAVTHAVRSKESKNDYGAKSKSSSASGAYQYINKTWKGSASKYGVDTKQFPTAKSAPKEVQDKVFTNDLQKNANKYGSLEKAVNVHYTGNPGGKVSAAGLKANRGQTGGGYMADIKKRVDDYNTERKSTMGAAQQMAANFSGGSKSLSTPDSTQFAKAPEAPKPTQVASAPEKPKMQNPDQNITKIASTPAPTQVSQLDTKDKKQISELRAETLGSYVKKAAASRKKSLQGNKADIKTWGKRQKGITTAIKQLTKENSGQKDWDVAVGPMGKFAEQTYFHPTHKHTARLSKEKAMKPDNIIEPGGVKGHVSPHMHTEQTKETTMDNQNLINEALENILENNLNDMKENLLAAINEKAMEKLEERKKAIAADYFAQ